MGTLRAWLIDEEGATAIEYSLIASLFSVACIAAYLALSDALVNLFTTVSSQLNSAAAVN